MPGAAQTRPLPVSAVDARSGADQTVARQIGPAVRVGDERPGFPGDDHPRGDVVDLEPELPVAVVFPRRDLAEIEGGGAVPADALKFGDDAAEELQIGLRPLVPDAGEARGEEGILESGAAGSAQGDAVAEGPAARFAVIELAEFRHADGPGVKFPPVQEPDGNAPHERIVDV